MNPAKIDFATPRRLASSVLTVLMLYQLGACPCGCLEHNFWMESIGLGDHHHPVSMPVSGDGNAAVSDAHDHDCTGMPKPQYVNNSRSLTVNDPYWASLPDSFAIGSSVETTRSGITFQQGRPPDSLPVAHALSRPALQVYRL